MSRRDALATLLQLRRRALDAATQDLAVQLAAQAQAEAAAARTADAVRAEATTCGGSDAAETRPTGHADFASWLPRGQQAAAAAAAVAADAAFQTEAARQALRHARTECELATSLADRRAAAARADLLQREQAALDEVAAILRAIQ